MKWINVKDRLPDGVWNENHTLLSEEVLVANSCCVDIGYYNRFDECWYVGELCDEIWIDKVTHWMELPENPNV